MKVFVIVDEKGKFVSAWPRQGIAKIHCRTELKDRVRMGYCTCSWLGVKPKSTKGKPAKKAKRAK